jgi:hypothetical protein
MDVTGNHQLDLNHHIVKIRLDKVGDPIGSEEKHELHHTVGGNSTELVNDKTKLPGYCGPCYGAEDAPGQCCNTCDDVRAAYRNRGWAMQQLNNIEQCVAAGESATAITAEIQRNEGCQMFGYLDVNKVAGNFHFSPGKSFQHQNMHVHDISAFQGVKFNTSHTILSVSYGEQFPGIVNPLTMISKLMPEDTPNTHMFMYYTKIVPTSFNYLDGRVVETNQYSITEHSKHVHPHKPGNDGLPGVFVFYELSPIMVRKEEVRSSIAHFLTQLCAILGTRRR